MSNWTEKTSWWKLSGLVMAVLLCFVSARLWSDAYYNFVLATPHRCGPLAEVQTFPSTQFNYNYNWGGAVSAGTATQSLTETAGNLLVVVTYFGGDYTSVAPNEQISLSDSLGNTYYPGPLYTNASTYVSSYIQIWYSPNILGGANTITLSASGNSAPPETLGLFVTEYTGIATANVVDVSSGLSAPSSTLSISPGTITTSTNCELIVAAVADSYQGNAVSWVSTAPGWQWRNQSGALNGQSEDNAATGAIQGSVVNPVMVETSSWGPTNTWVATQMAFRTSNTTALPQPTKLAFTNTPGAIQTNQCTALTIQSQNASSSPTNTATGISATLSGSNIIFYADSNCVFPITKALIGAGTNTQTFYFESTATGSPVISAAATGFTTINQTESVTANNAFTWIGGAGGAACTSAANFSNGSCWSGGVAPWTSDVAVFDSTCATFCNPTLTSDVHVYGIKMLTGTLTTLSQGAYTLYIGNGGFIMNAGTFTGSTGGITMTGGLTISGGTFNEPPGTAGVYSMTIGAYTQTGGIFNGSNVAAATTWMVGPYLLSGGTFNQPTGTWNGQINSWQVTGSPTFNSPVGSTLVVAQNPGYVSVKPGTVTYHNVYVTDWHTSTIDLNGQTMNVAGNLTLDCSFGGWINNGTFSVTGNVTQAGGGCNWQGTGWVKLAGNPSGQTISDTNGGLMPHVEVAAGANPVTLSGNIYVNGWKMTSVGTFNVAGSTLNYWCPAYDPGCPGDADYTTTSAVLIPGSVAYNNVSINACCSNFNFIGVTWTINGNLTIGESWPFYYFEGGTINVGGDVSSWGGGYGGSTQIVLTGNASGQTISGGGGFPRVKVAAGTNNVTLSGTVSVNAWDLTSVGTLTTTGSTLFLQCFSGDLSCWTTTETIVPGTKTYNNVTISGNNTNWNFGGSTMTIGGNLTMGEPYYAGVAFTNATLNVAGDVTAIGRGYFGTGMIVLTGNASGQTIYGNGNQLPYVKVAAGGNPVTLNGTVHVNHWNYVSSGTFTVTNSTLAVICPYGWEWNCQSTTPTTVFGGVNYNNVQIIGYNNPIDLQASTVNVNGMLTVGDNGAAFQSISNGTFIVKGGMDISGCGYMGNTPIQFTGGNAQTVNVDSYYCATVPGGTITANPSAGGSLTLTSDLILTGGSQNLTVGTGTTSMMGHALTVPGTVTINSGATLTKGGGTLTSGSLVNNGTINP